MSLKYYGFICLLIILLIIIVYPLAKFKYKGNCGCQESFQNKKHGLTYSNNIPEYNYLLKNYYPTRFQTVFYCILYDIIATKPCKKVFEKNFRKK